MKSHIRDNGDGKTVVVYTEEINLMKELEAHPSNQKVIMSRQYLVSAPWKTWILSFDMYFPKAMSWDLQQGCEISNGLEIGRDPQPRKVVGGEWHTPPEANEKLMFMILMLSIFECNSKTVHEVSQKLGGVTSEETIQKALESLSQPCMPLGRHTEQDSHTRYGLKNGYARVISAVYTRDNMADVGRTPDPHWYPPYSTFDSLLSHLHLK